MVTAVGPHRFRQAPTTWRCWRSVSSRPMPAGNDEWSASTTSSSPAPPLGGAETQTVHSIPISVTHDEGNSGTTTYTFTVTRTGGTTGQLDFSGTFADRHTDAADYVGGAAPTGFSGSILAGQTSATVTITSRATPRSSPTRPSRSPSPASPTPQRGSTKSSAPMTATGTITNDDVAPVPGQLSIGDVTLAEGDAGTTAFTFTVTRTRRQRRRGRRDLDAERARRREPRRFGRFRRRPGDLPARSASPTARPAKTITILVQGDDLVETDETFTRHPLRARPAARRSAMPTAPARSPTTTPPAPSRSTTSRSPRAIAAPPPSPSPSPAPAATTARSASTGRSTRPAAPASPIRPISRGGTVFSRHRQLRRRRDQQDDHPRRRPATSRSRTIETFIVTLSNATGGAAIGDGTGTGTINNDDAAPAGTLSIDDVSLGEGDVGTTTTFTFTVTRSAGTAGAITADYAISAPGGAGNASTGDFVAGAIFSGQVAFADGETSKTISIDVAGRRRLRGRRDLHRHPVQRHRRRRHRRRHRHRHDRQRRSAPRPRAASASPTSASSRAMPAPRSWS